MPNKLLVVADGSKAHFYEAKGTKILGVIESHNAAEFSIAHTKPEKHASHFQGGATAGHKFEPHTDPRDIERDQFSRRISALVQTHKQSSRFQELYLIAEPKMLGALRKNLDPKILAWVSKEISKDLADASTDVLQKAVFG
jgi:protein required for attachment to host cells